jgi:ADP-ribosylarginine hydrolase
MSIGLRYSQPSEFEKLMHVSIEISRLTHTHVSGFMGGFTSALFTSYAIQQKPLKTWIKCLLEILPNVKNYIQSQQRSDLEQNMRSW